MQYAPTLTDEILSIFLPIRPLALAVCGAYAVAPYTGTRKNGDFSVCSATGVAVYGAYAVAPYTDYQKPAENRVRISRGGGKGGGA